MKFLSMGLLAIAFLAVSSFNGSLADVYICKGPQSKKYHFKKDCRGLSNCSTNIYKVTLTEARQLGRGLCGWED